MLKNVVDIKKYARRVYVILQVWHFKDELRKAFNSCTEKVMYRYFKCEGKSEFKRKFCNIKNPLDILETHAFDIKRFCDALIIIKS